MKPICIRLTDRLLENLEFVARVFRGTDHLGREITLSDVHRRALEIGLGQMRSAIEHTVAPAEWVPSKGWEEEEEEEEGNDDAQPAVSSEITYVDRQGPYWWIRQWPCGITATYTCSCSCSCTFAGTWLAALSIDDVIVPHTIRRIEGRRIEKVQTVRWDMVESEHGSGIGQVVILVKTPDEPVWHPLTHERGADGWLKGEVSPTVAGEG